MFCSKCGARLDESAAFCSKCGAKVINNAEGGTAPQEVTAQSTAANAFSIGGLNERVFFTLGDLSEPISLTYDSLKNGSMGAARFDHLYNSFTLDMKDNMKKINTFFTKDNSIFLKGLMDKIYMYPDIPDKKLVSAKNFFTGIGNDETPLLLYDSREMFLVTDKCVYARNVGDKNIFSKDLRTDVTVMIEKANFCAYLVFDETFKVQVLTNKNNQWGFNALVCIVLKTAHLLRHLKGENMRFIDALNELRKMPLSSYEKSLEDPRERRRWADWIDFCYDEKAVVEF